MPLLTEKAETASQTRERITREVKEPKGPKEFQQQLNSILTRAKRARDIVERLDELRKMFDGEYRNAKRDQNPTSEAGALYLRKIITDAQKFIRQL